MKKIIFLSLLVLPLLFSCEKESEDVSRTTYYPSLLLQGESTVVVLKGSAFVDPGYYAELNEQDVTSDVVVTGSVNMNTVGVYVLTYTITNSDGIALSDHRTVYVADNTPSVLESRVYTVSAGTHRIRAGVRRDYSGNKIVIYQTEPGLFYAECGLGGYYYQFPANYGSNYAAGTTFKVEADNSITLISSSVPGWGDSLTSLTASLDPVTGTITWNAVYAAMQFNVIFNK